MLGLPKSTEFSRRIPKQKFYENLTISPALKRIFVEQIRVIWWRNKIAPSTMNLAAGETVTEIEVFEVCLSAPQLDEAVLRQIDNLIFPPQGNRVSVGSASDDNLISDLTWKLDYLQAKQKGKVFDEFCKTMRNIVVQLPEDIDPMLNSSSANAKRVAENAVSVLDELGCSHILTELAKERIRRAAKKIAEENPGKPFDGGFRVFKLDDTNMTDVYYSAGEYSQDMPSLLESNIKPDRTDLDLLFGCLLEWGLPLSMPYTSEQIEGCTVHTYNDGDLIACFDENIPDAVIKEIARRQPLRAVFRDSSFADSPAKINVGEIFKMLAPDTRVKVL